MVDVGTLEIVPVHDVWEGWSSVLLAKARSEFVPEFKRAEWKLSASFELYRRVKLLAVWCPFYKTSSIIKVPHDSVRWQLKSPAYRSLYRDGWPGNNDALLIVRRVGGGFYTLMIMQSWPGVMGGTTTNIIWNDWQGSLTNKIENDWRGAWLFEIWSLIDGIWNRLKRLQF